MKRTYILKYKTGWGEKCEIHFEARYATEAQNIAKNYCTRNFIPVARLYTPSGKYIFI